MSRTRILLAVPAMTQVKAVKLTVDLKGHCAAQTRTEMIWHHNFFHGLWATGCHRATRFISAITTSFYADPEVAARQCPPSGSAAPVPGRASSAPPAAVPAP